MFAFEFAGGLGHGGFVERARIVERALVFEWREDLAAPDAVAVGFSLGLPASVEIGADFFRGDDADCGRKEGVQGALEFGGRESGLRFEMGDLSEGVDAGIGAACAVDEDFFLGDLAGGFGDGALNGRLARLDLPAVEGGAVVGNGEFEEAHLAMA